MFTLRSNVLTSDILSLPTVRHAFSTRLGGVSTDPATREMNVAPVRADSPECVRENIGILASTVGCTAKDVVCTHQIHSNLLRYVSAADRGDGVLRAAKRECDGFYTDVPGVVLMVRTADCAPVLLAGLRDDGTPAVCAVHAGWRGSCAGISAMAVAAMVSMGVRAENIRAAIGPCAHFEAFEVGEDMRDAVRDAAGADFTARHVRDHGGRLHADVCGMNVEFLRNSGVPADGIDVSDQCTITECGLFHSHRATKGNRGAMGNVIVIAGYHDQ